MSTPAIDDPLMARAKALKLYGMLAHWEELGETAWITPLIQWEEQERAHRSLERRLGNAHLGRFRALADFDCPNGVGKSTIARNIAHQAVLAGHTVLCTSAGHMLNELAGADGDNALRHRLSVYARPRLLLIDEIGYLSYSNRHADLLFEIVSRRYQEKSTLVTTNRPFAEWGEVFPNAACVVSLVDRLVHNAEIIHIEGESYRLKEAKERSEARRKQRTARNTKPRSDRRS
jgi:adenylate kinase family enzyme